MCEQIKSFNISPLFFRLQMWSWFYGTFLPSPLVVFEPIQRYTGRWSDLVDWYAVNELLHRLDYRRQLVKIGGTRAQWFEKFRGNWINIRVFDSFYRILLHSGFKCFKPTYEVERFDCLATFNSPYYSARWILDDYATWGDP
jgi:hypothetical protein